MPALRVRVESAPPLHPLKAWFPLSEDKYETVLDLQSAICSRLNVKYSEIILTLDGYELFTGSTIRDVVRDGELIVVRSTRKPAKRTAEPEPERPRKRAKLLPAASKPAPAAPKAAPPVSSPSSSSASSDSSDSSSVDTSSDSDSSSDDSPDSDTDSDSTSSSDSGPSVLPDTKPLTQPRKASNKSVPAATATSKPRPSTPHVPPGHGKPSTQSRNARRRKKREFERAEQSAPIAGASSANSMPLGTHPPFVLPEMPPRDVHLAEIAKLEANRPSHDATHSDSDGDVMTNPKSDALAPPNHPLGNRQQPDMFSLSNKNKRRGFKRSMANIPPQRITFSDDADADASLPGPSSIPLQPSTSRPASPSKPPRLIPPSEKAALGLLPPGMIVTSVDVEAGMWPSQNFDKKRKKKQRDAWGQEDEYIPTGRDAEVAQEGDWDGALPYDEDGDPVGVKALLDIMDEATGAVSKQVKEEMLDWSDLEARFDSAQPAAPESLTPGSVVAWKEFGVHPVRLSPEMVVHAATVQSVDAVTGKVSVQIARRQAAFGMLDEEGEIEVAEYEIGAVGQLGWKRM